MVSKINKKMDFRKGISLLDTLLALIVIAMVLANINQMQNDMANNMNSQAVANDLLSLKQAAKTYIASNAKTLSQLGNNTIEVPIVGNQNWNGIGDLTSTGLLPENYSPNLAMGQKVKLLIRNVQQNGTVPQHIDAMLVTTDGNPMNDRQVGLAMAKMGGDGGGIMKNPPPGVSKSNIQGSFASWYSPISKWGNLNYGHVALNLNSSLSPVAEWLNRYDTGNPEANRMHTNIDMNSNSLNNTYSINAKDDDDLLIQTGSHQGRIVSNGGIRTCMSDRMACGIQVSNDGGFYDMQDTWITYSGSYNGVGLRIAGNGNNLDVLGKTLAQQGLIASNANGISWASSPSVNGAIEASATFDGSYVNFTGGSTNFQGIYANIMKTSKVLDANNNDYYLIPSGDSHLRNTKFEGTISTNGYDLKQGVPSTWSGGVNTFDLITHGTGGFAVDNNGVYNIMVGTYGNGMHRGNIIASEDIAGQIFMPNFVAVVNDNCNVQIQGSFGNQNSFWISNGAIARDEWGGLLSCTNGTWQAPHPYYKGVLFQQEMQSWTNSTGYPVFLIVNGITAQTSWSGEPDWSVTMDGITVCQEAAHSGSANYMGGHLTCSVMVPNKSSVNVTNKSGGARMQFIMTGIQ